MNRKLFISIGFIFFFINSRAQDINVSLQTGYGFYSMRSLELITDKSAKELPFNAKIISNYPAYHYYQPMIKLSKPNFDFGFVYTFQTTGSRISYKDYSGEYRLDSKINCNSPGIIFIYRGNGISKLKAGISLKTGINFSVLKWTEYLKVDNVVNNNLKFRSQSFYFEPGVNLTYSIDRLSFELNLEYYKEFSRENYLQSGDSKNYIPVNKKFNGEDIWDGFRLGITFTYTLYKTNKTILVYTNN